MNTPSPVISPLQTYLNDLHARHRAVQDGEVATYIPELAKADPEWFGICLVTAGGQVYEAGDTRQAFTIQSISKPFVYGLALEDNSRGEVLSKVGVEPTGDAFNAISLEPVTGRPRNPMINAGAIASAGLVAGKNPGIRWNRVLEMLSAFAGEALVMDQTVYRSESETGHRNRAIGHMLRNFGILSEDPDPVVDQYFRQCSVSVTCRHLAVMAATLANRGINPLTHRRAIRGEYVESVLGVMGSCGMYDYAGEWLYRVGMPAKSGVAGGVIAVLPGQLGIGVFSPRLDLRGNSVRGLAVCDDLSRDFDLHLFNNPHEVRSVIRLSFTALDVTSSRARSEPELEILERHARGIRVYQLQGHLTFSSVEVVVGHLVRDSSHGEASILDLKHVVGINECACRLLHDLVLCLDSIGHPVVFTHVARFPHLRRVMKGRMPDRFERLFHSVEDLDRALEWCEDRVLMREHPSGKAEVGAELCDFPLLAGLTAEQQTRVRELLRRRSFRTGEVILEIGAPAGELFLLVRGQVVISLPIQGEHPRRLGSFGPGMVFGEMALLDQSPRSAMVTAETDVDCDLLTREDFDRLGTIHPEIQILLLRNLALLLSAKLRKANHQIGAMDT